MRRTLVAGNWKMNTSLKEADNLLSGLLDAGELDCDLAVFPPFPYLLTVAEKVKGSNILFGAQNCSDQDAGAYTGEVSVSMVKDTGAGMVLVGHSERRSLYGETDQLVLAKTQKILTAGLTAVVCVGETLAERQASHAEQVVEQQLALLLEQLSESDWQNIVIAYEPVWAIGTGETATPEQAQEIHAYIRSLLAKASQKVAQETRVLYGGSVKAANAAELFSQPDIDGGLVGGASLDAAEFTAICRA